MPVYNYQCPKCKTVVEKYVPTMTGDLTFLCECGTAMKKQFSGQVAVHFKGFGFPDNDAKLFKTPPDAKEKLKKAGFKENKMDVKE